MSPQNEPAPFPRDELHAAEAHPDARSAVDALHAEVTSAAPDPRRIEAHVGSLRLWPSLVGTLERWYLDPRTQTFIADLTAAGL